jgi:probable HAF family extracellular repeat protein
MNRILSITHWRRMITAAFLTALLFLNGVVLRPVSVHAQAPTNCYTATELTLGGTGADAMYFTRSGYVLGYAGDSNNDYHTFVYNATGMHDLDAALNIPGSYFSVMEPQKALSEEGSVLGAAMDNSSSNQMAVLFDDTGLHQLSLGGVFSVPIDINDAGQAIGAATDSSEATLHAFRYDHGTMVDIGTLGGSRSYPYAISENGNVVGEAANANDDTHAFLYDDVNGIQDLGVLTGGSRSQAVAVNNAGQAAGYSEVTGGGQHAFLYDGTGMIDLGVLSGGSYSSATHINASGQVVGIADNSSYQQHIFLYDGTSMQDLTPDAEYAEVLRFTDSGVVVGTAYMSQGYYVFVYDSTGLHNLSLGGDSSDAYGSFGGYGATNASGSVAGFADTTDNEARHAFLYDSNGLQDLNSLPGDDGWALGINAGGQVVGISNDSAFLYDGVVMSDLNSLLCGTGVTLNQAIDISDDGKILAADTQNGHLYMLTPSN